MYPVCQYCGASVTTSAHSCSFTAGTTGNTLAGYGSFTASTGTGNPSTTFSATPASYVDEGPRKYSPDFWRALCFLATDLDERYAYVRLDGPSSRLSNFIAMHNVGMGLVEYGVSQDGMDVISKVIEAIELDQLPTTDLYLLLSLLKDRRYVRYSSLQKKMVDSGPSLWAAWEYLGALDEKGLTVKGRKILWNNLPRLLEDQFLRRGILQSLTNGNLPPSDGPICEQLLKLIEPGEWAILLTKLEPDARSFWAEKANK